MKIKNKGKVYPSPSSSSSSSNGDYLSVLKLLPAAILALASVLSLEDREVLAYLITRSIKTTTATASSSSSIQRKASKKAATGGSNSNSNSNSNNNHRPPVFDCDCFDCYTSYWFRWDSSPNRELIHQAIEAFEDHLANGEASDKLSNKKNGKAKRRDKTARRSSDNNKQLLVEETNEWSSGPAAPSPVESSPENVVPPAPLTSPENEAQRLEENEVVVEVSAESSAVVEEGQTASILPSSPPATSSSHKGLARKVLPDVLGLFNSRLWSLWSPNA